MKNIIYVCIALIIGLSYTCFAEEWYEAMEWYEAEESCSWDYVGYGYWDYSESIDRRIEAEFVKSEYTPKYKRTELEAIMMAADADDTLIDATAAGDIETDDTGVTSGPQQVQGDP